MINNNKYAHRVVITGIGIASPLGNTCEDLKHALINGKSAVNKITRFDASDLDTKIAAETSLPDDYIADNPDHKSRFMYWAANNAFNMSCLNGDDINEFYKPNDRLISLGVGLDLFSTDRLVESYHLNRLEEKEPQFYYSSEAVLHNIAKKYHAIYPPHKLVSACAASADAVGIAVDSIITGKVKWALAGGMDSMINPMGFAAFSILGAMSKRNTSDASRPFDKYRDGFIMGEGAGAIILERADIAKKRGAKILGEMIAFGNSLDAYGISDPDPKGDGAARAMEIALRYGRLKPNDIDYINAHGTSTPKNDIAETFAIKQVFKNKIPLVSSTKSMIGHCISASGIIELIGVFLTQQESFLPPTINLETQDEFCDLDYISGKARKLKCEYFMSNSFAFGGQNTSLIGRIVN